MQGMERRETINHILNILYIHNTHFSTITNSCEMDLQTETGKDDQGQVLIINCNTATILFGVSRNIHVDSKVTK